MTQQDKEQLKLEIDHIFESGANKIRIFEMVVNFIDSRNGVNKNFVLADVSHSMTGDGMNCLEFFDMIKKEWCVSEEQHKPFWNDVLTFARKYHKERKE